MSLEYIKRLPTVPISMRGHLTVGVQRMLIMLDGELGYISMGLPKVLEVILVF